MELNTIVVGIISEISKLFITFVSGFSLIVFMWGIVKYLWKGDSEDARQKGKQLMIWGLIGLFVMFAVWGIVALIGNTFGITTTVPQFSGGSAPSETAPAFTADDIARGVSATGDFVQENNRPELAAPVGGGIQALAPIIPGGQILSTGATLWQGISNTQMITNWWNNRTSR